MIAAVSSLSVLGQWRRQLGGRFRPSRPRLLATMGFLTDTTPTAGLIEIERLTMVLVYDEPIRSGQCAVRLAGFGARRVPWGICFGGQSNRRFTKDLMLQPVEGADGYRLDLADEELLALGLKLERDLDRDGRFPKQVRDRPHLPRLWAAFPAEMANEITGDGPELGAYARRMGKPPKYLLELLCREHQGLTIFPLSWVSHHWHEAVAVFADLNRFPQRQVFRLTAPEDLAGFHDAAEFDFLTRRARRRQPALAVA